MPPICIVKVVSDLMQLKAQQIHFDKPPVFLKYALQVRELWALGFKGSLGYKSLPDEVDAVLEAVQQEQFEDNFDHASA